MAKEKTTVNPKDEKISDIIPNSEKVAYGVGALMDVMQNSRMGVGSTPR